MFADLVLEGGGVKGIALVGAISVLEERGYEFRRVAGTSAGAIVGSLVAADARAAQLEEIMRAVEYRRFRDGPRWRNLLLGKAAALLFDQGIYEGQYLRTGWASGSGSSASAPSPICAMTIRSARRTPSAPTGW